MADSARAKICAGCGLDVHGLKRTKDASGRYWCADCFRKAAVRSRGGAPGAPGAPGATDPLADARAAGPSAEARHPGPPGHPERPGFIDDIAAAHVNVVVRRTSGVPILLTSAFGAFFGGVVGAVIWAVVAHVFHIEISWIAIAVGALAGAGALIGARGCAGPATGAIAALVAVLSILGGKLALVATGFGALTEQNVDGALAIELFASDLHDEAGANVVGAIFRQRGFAIAGRRLSRDEALAEAQLEWEALDEEDRNGILDVIREDLDAVRKVPVIAKREGFAASLHWLDGFFALVAILAAFAIGRGGTPEGK